MYRAAKDSDLAGKTVKRIDSGSVNTLKLFFTDGTSLTLWAEQAIHTNAGSIPGIFVDDPAFQGD